MLRRLLSRSRYFAILAVVSILTGSEADKQSKLSIRLLRS
jgi:hypothetical protein